jgi:type IV secretory pathway VirJ component
MPSPGVDVEQLDLLHLAILLRKYDQPMKAFAAVCMTLFCAIAGANPTRLSHGRFKELLVYAPPAQATNLVLFLSGDGGWDASASGYAEALASQGAMVVGIDLKAFNAVLDADGGQCVFPDGDLENLSHFVQAYFHSATYLAPTLVGLSAGGAMAYAVLAQAPKDTFAAALSLGFCPTLSLDKPLCTGSGLESSQRALGRGVNLAPIKSLSDPWVVLQSSQDRACPAAAARDFVGQVHGAAIAVLPLLQPRALNAAFAKLTLRNSNRNVPTPAALGDLPVVEVPAQPNTPNSDTFAIIMSGDGGWAGLDQDIAAALSAKGIPVVGWDSLRYYWTARTPEGLAADTDRMIRYYLAHFGKKRVLLIGYSQGADVLPFAVNRLPADSKAQVALAAILGMSEHALFEFHVSSWISDSNSGPATLPEVNRISGMPVLCIYGEDEHDSLCPQLDAKKFNVVKVKGGHHFDGNYAGLAAQILSSAKP